MLSLLRKDWYTVRGQVIFYTIMWAALAGMLAWVPEKHPTVSTLIPLLSANLVVLTIDADERWRRGDMAYAMALGPLRRHVTPAPLADRAGKIRACIQRPGIDRCHRPSGRLGQHPWERRAANVWTPAIRSAWRCSTRILRQRAARSALIITGRTGALRRKTASGRMRALQGG